MAYAGGNTERFYLTQLSHFFLDFPEPPPLSVYVSNGMETPQSVRGQAGARFGAYAKGGPPVVVAAHWSTMNTCLVVLAAIIAIVLIVLMSTKKPGPRSEAEETSKESEVE